MGRRGKQEIDWVPPGQEIHWTPPVNSIISATDEAETVPSPPVKMKPKRTKSAIDNIINDLLAEEDESSEEEDEAYSQRETSVRSLLDNVSANSHNSNKNNNPKAGRGDVRSANGFKAKNTRKHDRRTRKQPRSSRFIKKESMTTVTTVPIVQDYDDDVSEISMFSNHSCSSSLASSLVSSYRNTVDGIVCSYRFDDQATALNKEQAASATKKDLTPRRPIRRPDSRPSSDIKSSGRSINNNNDSSGSRGGSSRRTHLFHLVKRKS